MRGVDEIQEGLFTMAKLDEFVPADHPLRSIRVLVNDALAAPFLTTAMGFDCITPKKQSPIGVAWIVQRLIQGAFVALPLHHNR
jgi:hypothetical protein